MGTDGGKVEEGRFDAGNALEDLHVDLQRIEALSHAANQALERVPRADDAEERRALARLYALVTTTYDLVADALDEADDMVRRLGIQMQERREEAEQPAPARGKRAAAKAGRGRKQGSQRKRFPLVAQARERSPGWGLDAESPVALVERMIESERAAG